MKVRQSLSAFSTNFA